MLSVIIPVKNGSSTLASCLESIVLQKCNFPLEILIIDSGSSDSSIEIAESYGARVLRIKSSDFNHGLTRNYGISEAAGNFLFFTVQDAKLSDDSILQKMMDWFLYDDIMGVCGHQAVPHDLDKNPLLWFKRFTEPVPEVRKLSLGDPMPSYSWDNVCSMYRKVAFDLLPFEEIDTCEDWIWAYNALNRGWKIVYDPSLVIYHYHHRTFLYTLKTEYGVNYILNKHINLNPKWPGWLLKNIKAVYHLTLNKSLNVSEKFYWISYNLISNTAHCLAFLIFFVSNLFDSRLNDFIFIRFCKVVPQGKQNKSWN